MRRPQARLDSVPGLVRSPCRPPRPSVRAGAYESVKSGCHGGKGGIQITVLQAGQTSWPRARTPPGRDPHRRGS